MTKLTKRVLITGGAGFIGSQLCEKLVSMGHKVSILDNFSSGKSGNIRSLSRPDDRIRLIKGDCKNPRDVKKALSRVQVVYHFAAKPEIRLDRSDPSTCFNENIYATYVLLEQMKNSEVETIGFASSSTVYGEAKLLPTPEDYGPLEPISIYGASKLASEGLISAYAHSYRMKAVILRLANIIGLRSNHGIISDFLKQIQKRPRELKILGDGNQTKSYLHIDDCISAILGATRNITRPVNVINIGSEDQLDVSTIAKLSLEEARLENTRIKFTQTIPDGRGWNGDVRNMLLDISKLRSLGWRPKYTSEQAVRLTMRSQLHGGPKLAPTARSQAMRQELVSA
ncbi:MAG: hypothetical protein AUJ07_12310 [Crenarchaeota archaeon 13_1_40CM_3_53_5]|nr:MAG: hypothetical protein AUJ07_12310 [Crenarchaeota archaeon 13_1_40CM_3_53_5]